MTHVAPHRASATPFVAPPAASRSARVRLTTGLAALTTVASLAIVVETPATAAPAASAFTATANRFQSSSTVNVADGFARSVRTGLGSAPRGGRYTTQSPRSRYSVKSGRATISRLDPKATRGLLLRSVTTTDQRLRVEFSVPSLPKRGAGTTAIVALRTQANGDMYRAQVRVARGGKLRLSVARVRRGTTNVFGSAEIAVRGSARPGRHLYLDGVALGTSPVRLAARAWVRGAAVPRWQLVRTDSTSTRVARAGHVGVYFYRSARSGAGRATIHSLSGWTPLHRKPVRKPGIGTVDPAPAPSDPAPTPSGPGTDPTPTDPTPTDPTPTDPGPTDPTSSDHHTTDGAAPGSLPVGAARYAVPDDAIVASPDGDDKSGVGSLDRPFRTLARALSASRAGNTIVLRGGSYNESNSVTKAVTIQNYPGEAVWMDGSIPVSGWRRSGNAWVHDNWNYRFDSSASFSKGSNAGGFVDPKYPLAAHPDQVFFDEQPLVQVAANPAAGQFAVDYAAGTIAVGSDPDGRSVKASNLQQALVIGPGNTTVRGIGVRNYATSLWQMGTVYIGGRDGHTTLRNVVVSHNATEGIALFSHDLLLDHVTSSGNGMTGIEVSQSNDSVVQNTVISDNNREHFNAAPATAGIKIHRSDDFTVRNCVMSGNIRAAGIWTDINVTNFRFVGNTLTGVGQEGVGVLAELSAHGIVADNKISGFATGFTAMDAAFVKVFNNRFADNKLWDIGTYQDDRYVPGKSTAPSWIKPTPDNPWVVQHITFSNNDMSASTGTFQLHPMDYYTNRSADVMSLVVDGNLFRAGNTRMIGWGRNDNRSTTNYGTVAEFQKAKNTSWRNAETRTAPAALSDSSTRSIAVPLPADVASAMGAATGTQRVGTTW